jgi:hypothetical protein
MSKEYIRDSLGRLTKCSLHIPRRETKYGNCRQCSLDRSKEWRLKNKDKVIANSRIQNKKQHLRKFNLTQEDYNRLEIACGNKCSICLGSQTYKIKGQTRRLDIDHCHKTGKVRGLLCSNCNRAIGLLKDDVKVLSQAIEYLKSYSGL